MPLLKSSQRRLDTQREIIEHFSQLLPSFDDLFDQHSWHIFFICLTLFSFFLAFIFSRYMTLNDADYEPKTRRTKRYAGVKRTRLL